MDPERRIAELQSELAAKDVRIAEQGVRIAELTKAVAELTERLGRNSSNSNKPPSSDPPKNRAERRAQAKEERKRGAQPGHTGSKRVLVAPEQVDEFVDLFPKQCENCWAPLPQQPDPSARRYQAIELPPVKPHTTEYRQHRVACPCCKHRTWGPYDQVPTSPFGPRLSSVIALLTGVYHLSRRAAVDVVRDTPYGNRGRRARRVSR